MAISKFITRNPQRINRSMEFPEDVMMRAPTDQAPFNVLDYGQLAAPVFNFAKSVAIGPSEPYVSDTMKDQLIQKAMDTGLDKGTLGYEDFGLPVATEGGRFTGGLFDLALNDPVSFANVGSVGRVSFEKDPTAPGGYRFGDTKYDFSVDKDTGSTDNAFLDFINQGGIKSAIGNLFFTPAYAPEVTEEERKSIERQPSSFRSLSDPEVYGDLEERKNLLERILEFAPFIGEKSLTGILTNALGGAKDKLTGFRDAVGRRLGPAPFGTSQAAFNALTPSQQQSVASIYGQGGIMQGYNPISAFGRGPVGAIQNRIDNIIARKYAGKKYGKRNLARLQRALQQVGGEDTTGGGDYSQAPGRESAAAQEASNRDAARGRF